MFKQCWFKEDLECEWTFGIFDEDTGNIICGDCGGLFEIEDYAKVLIFKEWVDLNEYMGNEQYSNEMFENPEIFEDGE